TGDEQASVRFVRELEPAPLTPPRAERPPDPVPRLGKPRHPHAVVGGKLEEKPLVPRFAVHQTAPDADRTNLGVVRRDFARAEEQRENAERAAAVRDAHSLVSIVTVGRRIFSLIMPRICLTCGASGAMAEAASMSADASAYISLSQYAKARLLYARQFRSSIASDSAQKPSAVSGAPFAA